MVIPQLGPFISISEVEMWAILCSFALMVLDLVSGLTSAVVRHDFQSTKMREGLGHKAMIVLVLVLAIVVQGFSSHVTDLGITVPLIVPVCCYVGLMEISSIIENVCSGNPELEGSKVFDLFRKDDEK